VEHFTNDDTTAQDYTRMKHIPKYESTSEIYISAYYSLGTLNDTFEIFFNSSFGQENHWYNYNLQHQAFSPQKCYKNYITRIVVRSNSIKGY